MAAYIIVSALFFNLSAAFIKPGLIFLKLSILSASLNIDFLYLISSIKNDCKTESNHKMSTSPNPAFSMYFFKFGNVNLLHLNAAKFELNKGFSLGVIRAIGTYILMFDVPELISPLYIEYLSLSWFLFFIRK